MSARQFTESHVTDAKRVVRGEHYRAAGSLLRARSVDRKSLHLLTLGGHSFMEDISSARHQEGLGKSARIVVVDRDLDVVQKVRDAGLTNVRAVHADLFAVCNERRVTQWLEQLALDKFDCLNLDFTSPVFGDVVRCVTELKQRGLTNHGVLITTCSYGRDNTEFFLEQARGEVFSPPRFGDWDGLAGRVIALWPAAFKERRLNGDQVARVYGALRSVLVYKGPHSPMFSTLWQHRNVHPLDNIEMLETILRVKDSDLRSVLLNEGAERGDLYATPATRLAAWRAVESRKANPADAATDSAQPLRLVP